MPITGAPFALKDTSLTLELVEGGGTAQEYRCQLSRAELVPSQGGGGGAELTTFCDTYSEASGESTWELQLEGFQSFKEANDFAIWAFTNEGKKAKFVLAPGQGGGVISQTNPGFGGEVTVKPTNVGGTAKDYAKFAVTLKVTTKPDVLTAPPALAFAE